MVKTAVIGASGFIGGELLAAYCREFPDCIGTGFSNSNPGLTHFDLRAPDVKSLQLVETGHQAVILAAAKPLIGYCKGHSAEAHAVNVEDSLSLARRPAKLPLHIIFLSSDYVFAGDTRNYDDDSATNSNTNYGRDKVCVEDESPRITDNHLILRQEENRLDRHQTKLKAQERQKRLPKKSGFPRQTSVSSTLPDPEREGSA